MEDILFSFVAKRRSDWSFTKQELIKLLNDLIAIPNEFSRDFEVEFRLIRKKRSGQQLKAYWRLVLVIKQFMNEKGNSFTKDQVSDWIKIEAGHYNEIEGNKIAKSIANKSDATTEDMKNIINFILEFGRDWKIKDCVIEDYEFSDLISYYNK